MCLLLVTLASELPSSTHSFPLCLIMHLDHALVGTTTSMSRESSSTSRNPPSIGFAKKSISCSAFASTFVVFFSTYSSSSKSLIIMTIGAWGEKCLRKPHNLCSNLSPIVATLRRASKIFRSTFLSFPKHSLFS